MSDQLAVPVPPSVLSRLGAASRAAWRALVPSGDGGGARWYWPPMGNGDRGPPGSWQMNLNAGMASPELVAFSAVYACTTIISGDIAQAAAAGVPGRSQDWCARAAAPRLLRAADARAERVSDRRRLHAALRAERAVAGQRLRLRAAQRARRDQRDARPRSAHHAALHRARERRCVLSLRREPARGASSRCHGPRARHHPSPAAAAARLSADRRHADLRRRRVERGRASHPAQLAELLRQQLEAVGRAHRAGQDQQGHRRPAQGGLGQQLHRSALRQDRRAARGAASGSR